MLIEVLFYSQCTSVVQPLYNCTVSVQVYSTNENVVTLTLSLWWVVTILNYHLKIVTQVIINRQHTVLFRSRLNCSGLCKWMLINFKPQLEKGYI